jgi:hypothetical protein
VLLFLLGVERVVVFAELVMNESVVGEAVLGKPRTVKPVTMKRPLEKTRLNDADGDSRENED